MRIKTKISELENLCFLENTLNKSCQHFVKNKIDFSGHFDNSDKNYVILKKNVFSSFIYKQKLFLKYII